MWSETLDMQGDLQNMMIEAMQKLSFRSPPILYHGLLDFGKTAANSWPTVLLFVVVMTPMMASCDENDL